MEEIIRIKDKRKGVFTVDNIVLNGYGSELGAIGIALYVVLCRYANRETQQAYPSLTLIRNETGMDRRTIIKSAERLEQLRLIKRRKVPGRYTIYTLLEPRRLTSSKNATGSKITRGSSKITQTSSKSRRERMKKRNEENNTKSMEKLGKVVDNYRPLGASP